MTARNPRILTNGGQVPNLVVSNTITTGTMMIPGPASGLNYLIKQIIISNMGSSANVVNFYLDTTTTVSTVERVIETSVAADSTTILYINLPMVDVNLDLYANATSANEVNVTVIGDIEAV